MVSSPTLTHTYLSSLPPAAHPILIHHYPFVREQAEALLTSSLAPATPSVWSDPLSQDELTSAAHPSQLSRCRFCPVPNLCARSGP